MSPGGGTEELTQNTYRRVLLRTTLEATMSAPTYFTPMERFVDGGTTTHNNPSLAAVPEAVEYGADQNLGNPDWVDGLPV